MNVSVHTVPVVTERLARDMVINLDPNVSREGIISRAAEWLTRKDEGLQVYLGVVGRPYEEWERDASVSELWRVEKLACPFHEKGECLLKSSFSPEVIAIGELNGPWFWLPTAVLRIMDRPLLRSLYRNREIADAKMAILNRRDQFPVVLAPLAEGPFFTNLPRQKEVANERVSSVVPSRTY